HVFSATVMGGACGLEAPLSLVPSHGGVAAMLKSLALELPAIHCKAVDFESGRPAAELATLILDELSADDNEVEVGYRGSKRLVLRPTADPRDETRRPARETDSGAVFLVTGGGRGITAQVARKLATRDRPTLLIVGRCVYADGEAASTA